MRAMVEIAQHKDGQGVFQKDIAENQKISIKYLDQIISSLKAAELIINLKGKKSGYILNREADQITMADIFNAFEGKMSIVECLNPSVFCEFETKCKTMIFWRNLNSLISSYFESITVQDLMDNNIPEEFNMVFSN